MPQQDDGTPVDEHRSKERIVSSQNGVGSDAPPTNPAPGIQRLLVVSDAAVADVDELPPVVRAIIDAAIDVYVLTPTLPGRLAWLADDVDRFQHYADERLDTVLSHMHAIGADAGGAAARGSVVTVIADAVTAFEPDHILIALHVSEHANWQEHRLIEHVENRFRLPVTTFAVDADGHARTADGPLLLCYDGSEDAKHAIEHAGRLLGGRDALVVTVWQPTPALGSSASGADLGERVARDGVRIAQQAGLHAKPVAVEAAGPVWKTIVEIADRQDAAAIVLGSRGLTGLRPLLLGSVSSAIVHHADRPTLVIRQPTQQTGRSPTERESSRARGIANSVATAECLRYSHDREGLKTINGSLSVLGNGCLCSGRWKDSRHHRLWAVHRLGTSLAARPILGSDYRAKVEA